MIAGISSYQDMEGGTFLSLSLSLSHTILCGYGRGVLDMLFFFLPLAPCLPLPALSPTHPFPTLSPSLPCHSPTLLPCPLPAPSPTHPPTHQPHSHPPTQPVTSAPTTCPPPRPITHPITPAAPTLSPSLPYHPPTCSSGASGMNATPSSTSAAKRS